MLLVYRMNFFAGKSIFNFFSKIYSRSNFLHQLSRGENFDGQLGDGTTFPSIVPKRVKIKLNDDLSQVDLGATHSCALTRIKKTVYCWGSNWSSQLGDGSFAKSSTPKEISISDLQSETISTITDSSAMWHGQIKSSYFTAILTLIVYIF